MGATDPAGTREPQSGRGRDRCRLLRPTPALFSLQTDRWRHTRAISGLRKKHLKPKSAQVPPRHREAIYSQVNSVRAAAYCRAGCAYVSDLLIGRLRVTGFGDPYP